MAGPKDIALERVRGDTKPLRVKLTTDGAPIDVASWSGRWTISTEKDPIGTANQQAQISGAPATPTTDGIIEFAPALLDVDLVGSFYYDVEVTDAAGKVLTILKGKVKFLQDISK